MTVGMTLERGNVRLPPAEATGEDGSAICLQVAVSEAAGAGARRSARSRQALAAGRSGTYAPPAGVPGLTHNAAAGDAGLGPIEGGNDNGSRLVSEDLYLRIDETWPWRDQLDAAFGRLRTALC